MVLLETVVERLAAAGPQHRSKGALPLMACSQRSIDYAVDNGRTIRQTYLPVLTRSASGHLVFDEPDNCRKDGAGNAAACDLANECADIDRARGVGK